MIKRDKNAMHHEYCDICEKEIPLGIHNCIDGVEYIYIYFDEYFNKDIECHTTFLQVCNDCINDTYFDVQLLEMHKKDFTHWCNGIISDWKRHVKDRDILKIQGKKHGELTCKLVDLKNQIKEIENEINKNLGI